jgi:uncharacterized protein YjiK
MFSLACCTLLALSSLALAEDSVKAALPSWKFEQALALAEVPEPSGLCYCPPRDSFFIVDDGAEDRPASVSEINEHGVVLQNLAIGRDLEGVCYCPADGLIYVVDEHEERLYALLPDGLVLQSTFGISHSLDGQELIDAGGNGIEGIEYIPAGHGPWSDCFMLLNQDDPHRLLAMRRSDMLPEAKGLSPVCAYWDIASINAGSLHFDSESNLLWVVHSWMNVMELWNVLDMSLQSWEVVPGAAQEAVCVDGQGRLWIGSDSGGLASYTPAAN